MNTVLFVNVTLLNEVHLTSKQGITKYANTLPNFTKKKTWWFYSGNQFQMTNGLEPCKKKFQNRHIPFKQFLLVSPRRKNYTRNLAKQ